MKATLKIMLKTEVELTMPDRYTEAQMTDYAAGFAEGIRLEVAKIHGTVVNAVHSVTKQ